MPTTEKRATNLFFYLPCRVPINYPSFSSSPSLCRETLVVCLTKSTADRVHSFASRRYTVCTYYLILVHSFSHTFIVHPQRKQHRKPEASRTQMEHFVSCFFAVDRLLLLSSTRYFSHAGEPLLLHKQSHFYIITIILRVPTTYHKNKLIRLSLSFYCV